MGSGKGSDWLVTADLPALQGHFPGEPILPGVSILAAVLDAIEAQGPAIARCTWRVAKFHSPVRPGDRLSISIDERADGARAFTVRALASADGPGETPGDASGNAAGNASGNVSGNAAGDESRKPGQPARKVADGIVVVDLDTAPDAAERNGPERRA